MLKKLFKKKVVSQQPEIKSMYLPGSQFDSLYDFEGRGSARRFIEYYRGESVVYTPTNIILKAISSIDIVLLDKTTDKKANEYVTKHPVIDLLKQPNPFQNGSLFMKSMLLNYIVTGNAYMKIIGGNQSSRSAPVELECLSPQNINIVANQRDGYPETYEYSNIYAVNYQRSKADKRFYDSFTGNELTQLRNVNPNYGHNHLFGNSFFDAVESEILQYSSANQHNLALLNNQARPCGILTFDDNSGGLGMTDKQKNKIKQDIKDKLSGAGNAGRILTLEGGFKWTPLSQTMQDMDFANLQKQHLNTTFNALNIPLPLVSTDTMTFANMDSAKFALYDNAVLPLLKEFLSFLNYSLLPRYKGAEKLSFTYDPASIEALESRKVNNALTLSKIDAATDNEIRSSMGMPNLPNGGDDVYKPINQVPVGSQPVAPAQEKSVDSQELDIIAKMYRCKDAHGDDIYTKES